MFKHLSEAYGWTPQEIGGLTLAQASAYLGDTSDGYDTGRLAEARMKFARAAAEAKAADDRAKRRAQRGR